MKRIYVTHFPCRDGLTAEFLAHLEHPYSTFMRAAVDVRSTMRKIFARDDLNKCIVTFFDCCPDREDLEKLHSLAYQVEVYDHHISNYERCGDLPYTHFDMNESGCTLAWKKFWPDEPVPFFCQLIRDRDLWLWEIPNAQEYHAYIYMQPPTIDAWHQMFEDFKTEEGRARILEKGTCYKQMMDRIVSISSSTGKVHSIQLPVPGWRFTAVCSSILQSEIGNYLNEKGHSVVIVYHRGDNQWRFAVRSRKDSTISAKEIAVKMGGGGHELAAGFAVQNLDDITFNNPL
jgi:oligoribonuclease NrnB/cAMP/cGMP phosphodiesterase (DHH superfamily)